MRNAGEPSVEEILESIKKVIARDNRTNAAEQRGRREAVATPEPSRKPEVDDDILDLADSAAFAPDESLWSESRDTDPLEAPLITDGARGSMRESLAALAMLAQPGAQPQIVRSGETSLEGMVRDLLRPALAEWLDKHLPQLVERMVADEIARIVGKKA